MGDEHSCAGGVPGLARYERDRHGRSDERQIEALSLYEREGFVRIPLYGECIGSPLSICMEKRLQADP